MNNLGKKFSSLTAVKFVSKDARYNRTYLWLCDCGKTREVAWRSVQSLKTKACKDCASSSLSATHKNNRHGKIGHGMSASGIYNSWRGLKARCNNKEDSIYNLISYDAKWEGFEEFFADMKDGHFEGAHIDRVDNAKGYYKANCQWLTAEAHGIKTMLEKANAEV